MIYPCGTRQGVDTVGTGLEAYHVLATFWLMSRGSEKTFRPASSANFTYWVGVQRGGSSIPSASRQSNERQILQGSWYRTFNRLDVGLELRSRQILPLEPVRDHQFPLRSQQLGSISEEKLLIWQVAHRLRYPHAIKHALQREILAQLLSVQLHEAYGSMA